MPAAESVSMARTDFSSRDAEARPPAPAQPWRLPEQGLALFHGPGETARLSHYFLPRLIAAGKNVLILDGANAADPRLLERFARERNVAFGEFAERIRIARAFTCFQLTELVARVPRFLADFPAQALIVTAFPDLYFDEDIRDGDARVAFERALRDLRRWAREPLTPYPLSRRERGNHEVGGEGFPAGLKPRPSTAPLAVAIFSSAPVSRRASPARRQFFARVAAAVSQVWRFHLSEDGRPRLFLEHMPAGKAGRPLPPHP